MQSDLYPSDLLGLVRSARSIRLTDEYIVAEITEVYSLASTLSDLV